MSYEGLNELLQAETSLAARNRDDVDSMEFDTRYEIPTEGIGYVQLDRNARPYKAVVSVDGKGGAFKDIQSAVIYTTSVGGGNVLVKNGVYDIDGVISVPSGIRIIGELGLNVIPTAGTYSYPVFNMTHDSSFLFSGGRSGMEKIALTGLYDGGGGVGTAITLNGGKDYRFSDLYNEYSECFISTGSAITYSYFNNIYLSNGGIGSAPKGFDGGTATNNNLYFNDWIVYLDNNGIGFRFLAGGPYYFDKCRSEYGSVGFYIDSADTDRSHFIDCYAGQAVYGFRLVRCERTSFVGCASDRHSNTGWLLEAAIDNTIIGGISMDNTAYGINLGTGSSGNIVMGNNFRFCGTAILNNQSGGTVVSNIS